MTERHALQLALLIMSLSPLSFGAIGMIRGAEWLGDAASADLDSHFRYLSGIFFGLGLALLSCIRRIEAMTARFRWIALLVVIGGLARLGDLLFDGTPSRGHIAGLGAELIVTPLLVLWQTRLARAHRRD